MGQTLIRQRKVSGWVDKRFKKLFRRRKVMCEREKILLFGRKHMHSKKERRKFNFPELKF